MSVVGLMVRNIVRVQGGQVIDVNAVIAKHMRKGRQEDAHEFLRYAIDALQKSCLAGMSP